MAKFNGTYSYRAGYHGVRKSSGAEININSDFWTCANGHRNPSFELVDDRAKGGFVHREKVITCKQCAAQQPLAPDACPECGNEYSGACGSCAVGHERG